MTQEQVLNPQTVEEANERNRYLASLFSGAVLGEEGNTIIIDLQQIPTQFANGNISGYAVYDTSQEGSLPLEGFEMNCGCWRSANVIQVENGHQIMLELNLPQAGVNEENVDDQKKSYFERACRLDFQDGQHTQRFDLWRKVWNEYKAHIWVTIKGYVQY